MQKREAKNEKTQPNLSQNVLSKIIQTAVWLGYKPAPVFYNKMSVFAIIPRAAKYVQNWSGKLRKEFLENY